MRSRILPLLAAAALATAAHADNPAVSIAVDANAGRHAISPLVYGVAHAGTAALADLNVPLNRSGGNPTTRYNWQVNADNRGFDWYFQSLAYTSATPGEGGDSFVQLSKNAGALPMLTVPTIGWVAKLGPARGRLSSFSIAKYGAQQDSDWQWFPDAGNGVKANGQNVTGNDPNDASVLVDSTFQQGWVQHLVTKWGTAANGGVRYYMLDNEPSIWHSSHRDVRPTGVSLDEMKQKTIDYATKIKAVDAGAIVVGPEEWGWSGYFYSGLDQQTGASNGWSFFPDRSSHGNMDYLPWLLDQLKKDADANGGRRLLDVFSVHYYPQGGEFGNDTSTAMQLRRNRSTRSLWDPNYTDETWINDKVRLIPRIKGWVSTYYPGTKVGLTEYNWGAEAHINGATAQADVLGIFGREGLDLAAMWTNPAASTPTYKAIKMYRNYDGNKSTFGDTSVSATVPNPDNVSAFAARRGSDGALTVMVINKYLTANTPATISLANFPHGAIAQAWQLDAGNVIRRLADVAVGATSLTASLPPQSVTLFVIPHAPTIADADGNGTGDLVFQDAGGNIAAWTMDGTGVVNATGLLPAGSGWSVTHTGDFNGDGKADLLLRHTDGRVLMWLMNGTSVTTQIVLQPAASGWTATHVADMNGDGKADILWEHTNGTVAAWLMNGGAASTSAVFQGAGSGWHITHMADLNGDGKADILWQHADGTTVAWLMNGTTYLSSAGFTPGGSGWSITHTGDFNGDGKADLVFRKNDGAVMLWVMNGTGLITFAALQNAGTPWRIDLVGDLDGDGKADLVWRNTTDGSTYASLMNGTATLSAGFLFGANSGWTATHLRDLNGDGKMDVLWRYTDGTLATWLMSGLSPIGAAGLIGPSTWQVIP